MKEILERIDTTPYHAYAFTASFFNSHFRDGWKVGFSAEMYEPEPGAGDIRAEFMMFPDDKAVPQIRVLFQFLGTQPTRTRLTVKVTREEDWPVFRLWWDGFERDLKREGLIAETDELSDEIPNTTDIETLNNWWEKRGKHLGMTIKQLAAKSGVPYSTISNWRSENLHTRPYNAGNQNPDEERSVK